MADDINYCSLLVAQKPEPEEIDLKVSKRSPFDYIKMISHTKEIPEFDEEFNRCYVPYLTNQFFSNLRDTAMIANLANEMTHIPKETHFMFLHRLIPKAKRWGGWSKPKKLTLEIEMVQDVYKVNSTRARVMHSLLTKKQLKEIKDTTFVGSVKGN